MENEKINVALIRGDSLNEWEGKLWEHLGPGYSVTGFCSQKNLYPTKNLHFPIRELPATTDSFIINQFAKFTGGVFQKMRGLENALDNFQIAHTAEVSYFFTNQAVRAKKYNPKLKVVATVWDNSTGRFEHNYWPIYTPKFWLRKIKGLIEENKQGVDHFLPVSESSKAFLRSFGIPEEKMTVLMPAVVSPPATTKSAAEITRLPEDRLAGKEIYLSACRLVKEKGVYELLAGWQMFLNNIADKNKILLLVGKGPEKKNLVRLVEQLGLKESVIMIDSLPNEALRQLYGRVKATLLMSIPTPLWQEQFGYVLAESICAGTPVISTHSGAIPEVVGTAGILVSPGSAMELASALARLEDQAVYQSLKGACQTEQIRFSVERFTERLTSIYAKLV